MFDKVEARYDWPDLKGVISRERGYPWKSMIFKFHEHQRTVNLNMLVCASLTRPPPPPPPSPVSGGYRLISKIIKRKVEPSIQVSLKIFIGYFGSRASKGENQQTSEWNVERWGGGRETRKTVCNIACHAKWGEATVRLNTVFKHLQYFIICISRRQVTNWKFGIKYRRYSSRVEIQCV